VKWRRTRHEGKKKRKSTRKYKECRTMKQGRHEETGRRRTADEGGGEKRERGTASMARETHELTMMA